MTKLKNAIDWAWKWPLCGMFAIITWLIILPFELGSAAVKSLKTDFIMYWRMGWDDKAQALWWNDFYKMKEELSKVKKCRNTRKK